MRAFLHLLTFFLPVTVLAWLVTGPHGAPFAAVSTLLVLGPLSLDFLAPAERRDRAPGLSDGFFDGILWALTVLHLAVIVALPFHVAAAGVSVSAAVAVFLVIHTSAQGIVLAHELIHRPRKRYRNAGRLLMAGVLYEHFVTEHLRGHHRHVGTVEDPATARYGERFLPFLLRTVPGQFVSAWRIDRTRVLQGIAMGWGFALVLGVLTGPLGLAAHVLQAFGAVVLLEGVNYIEHWGLLRQGSRVQPADSWDSEGMLTYYMLIGLARHGDHHAHAGRPWQDLRVFTDTPKMPWGYVATVYTAILADFLLIPRLDAELRRCGLGPYVAQSAAR